MTKNNKALELGILLRNYRDNIFIRTYFLAQFCIRTILCILAYKKGLILSENIPSIFIIGFVGDFITSSFFLPIIVFLQRIKYIKLLGHIIFAIITFVIKFAQIFFWTEFRSNFNFVAVDFFIYNPQLHISTFQQYYFTLTIMAILIGSTLLSILTYRLSGKQKPNLKLALGSFIIAITIGKFYNSEEFGPVNNRFAHEISKNGIYEFCYAYFKNSPNYSKYYLHTSPDISLMKIRSDLARKNSFFIGKENLYRKIISPDNMIKKNVVIILIEDFSQISNLTPNIRSIADESMIFDNIYATGIDRFRGIEALTLSMPPLPGNSLIQRDNNRNLFNISSVFRDNNYVIDFIYGGYSYFNNLQNFLVANNFMVLDRGDFSSNEVRYKNIWNISDEDVFRKAMGKYDLRHNKNKNFFSVILTSSKNLSSEFLANKIDLKDQENDTIKYIDYAIGNFIKEAKNKDWFNNTIFVITSTNAPIKKDYNELSKSNYQIPLIIYAPKFIKATINDKLGSQIDIAPTILGLLNFDYDSKFFGQDLTNDNPARAFISTNLALGYIKNDHLTSLLPYNNSVTYRLENGQEILTNPKPDLINEAIAYYQTSYDLFTKDKMKEGL